MTKGSLSCWSPRPIDVMTIIRGTVSPACCFLSRACTRAIAAWAHRSGWSILMPVQLYTGAAPIPVSSRLLSTRQLMISWESVTYRQKS